MKLSSIANCAGFRNRLNAIAIACTICAASSLHAAVTTYTSQSAFLNALQSPAYFENFNTHSGQIAPSPEIFTFGPVGFTLADGDRNGIYYSSNLPAQGSVFPEVGGPGERFVITFTGAVTGVGGTFFLTDSAFDPVAGASLMATLATGETLVLASTNSYGTEPFGGFTSTVPITSLTLTAPFQTTNGTAAFLALDNLYVSGTAAIPEPRTWTMILGGIGALAAMQRARQKRCA